MKIIYLASFKANHPKWDVTYQDINGKRDIAGDMMDIDLTPYDVIIATPPCNYYSRGNYRRETSEYAQKTKHLLPGILDKLVKMNKPFIVENVRGWVLEKNHMYNYPVFIYEHGRHTYWTNIPFNPSMIYQEMDLDNRVVQSGKYKGKISNFAPRSKRQGGQNVHNVIEYWLEVVQSYLEPQLGNMEMQLGV